MTDWDRSDRNNPLNYGYTWVWSPLDPWGKEYFVFLGRRAEAHRNEPHDTGSGRLLRGHESWWFRLVGCGRSAGRGGDDLRGAGHLAARRREGAS